MATIKTKHPVREAFSENSSGTRYYDSKGEAIVTFESTLMLHGFYFGDADCVGWDGDEGRASLPVFVDPSGPFENPDGPDCVGYAHFTYYRMSSGRWEVIGYLS